MSEKGKKERKKRKKNMIEKIKKCGYIAAEDREEMVQAELMISSRQKQKIQAMLLLGDAGVGKTFFAECFARAIEGEVIFYQCHYGTGKEELLYDLDIKGVVERLSGGDAGDYLNPGILPRVINMCGSGKRAVLILDELDKTKPALDAFLLDFIQSGRIYDPHLGHFEVDDGELFLIATSNQERLLSEPLMRRFRRVYMKYPPEEVEVSIIKSLLEIGGVKDSFIKGVVKISGWLRRQEGIIKPPSTPELINLVQDVVILRDVKQRAKIVVSWLCAYEEDRTILFEKYPLSWWEGMLKDEDVLNHGE